MNIYTVSVSPQNPLQNLLNGAKKEAIPSGLALDSPKYYYTTHFPCRNKVMI